MIKDRVVMEQTSYGEVFFHHITVQDVLSELKDGFNFEYSDEDDYTEDFNEYVDGCVVGNMSNWMLIKCNDDNIKRLKEAVKHLEVLKNE